MADLHYLREPDEYGDRSWVCAWDDGGGIEIDAPGCGTASLPDDEAKVLLRWLQEHYANPEQDRYAAYENMTDYPEMLSGPYADDATSVED